MISGSIQQITDRIRSFAERLDRPVKIMEVCGTHTVSLRQTGVLSLLPEQVSLVSGPGCPVCITPSSYISNALSLIENRQAIVTTFGDMLKVPNPEGRSLSAYLGTESLRIVYSPAETLTIAADTEKPVVFLGIGFETTIPVIAAAFSSAAEKGIRNLFLYPAFKLVPPALRALLRDPQSEIDAFLLPGHVSAVIGTEAYTFLDTEYCIPGVVAGFEAEDMLLGILAVLSQLAEKNHEVMNTYTRVVRKEGNRTARNMMNKLLAPADALWRGFGEIPGSGMKLRDEYNSLDAETEFALPPLQNYDPPGCLCARVIQGKSVPTDCPLFGSRCTPEKPVGPCMVSTEGACAAHFKYGEQIL